MNRATKAIVSTIGVLLSIAGIDHGIFETVQGNTPTPGLIIQAIGDAQQMWYYGTEEAFTLIPNFLITGILAILVSLVLMVWSVGFVQLQHGATVFILLCALLFLVGGGVAQIVFFIPTWAAATRINRPLAGWQRVLPQGLRRVLAKLWRVFLVLCSVSFLIGLYIAIVGNVPWLNSGDPEAILAVCWSFIFGGGLGMMLLAFVAGFAYDIQQQTVKAV
ncbi:MAG: hypothetical protein GYA59_13590 [Chloroflexi bacterium]|nr:hypothetical protein [Chloroflexota bacterium]